MSSSGASALVTGLIFWAGVVILTSVLCTLIKALAGPGVHFEHDFGCGFRSMPLEGGLPQTEKVMSKPSTNMMTFETSEGPFRVHFDPNFDSRLHIAHRIARRLNHRASTWVSGAYGADWKIWLGRYRGRNRTVERVITVHTAIQHDRATSVFGNDWVEPEPV
jgi:hypothetical protein